MQNVEKYRHRATTDARFALDFSPKQIERFVWFVRRRVVPASRHVHRSQRISSQIRGPFALFSCSRRALETYHPAHSVDQEVGKCSSISKPRQPCIPLAIERTNPKGSGRIRGNLTPETPRVSIGTNQIRTPRDCRLKRPFPASSTRIIYTDRSPTQLGSPPTIFRRALRAFRMLSVLALDSIGLPFKRATNAPRRSHVRRAEQQQQQQSRSTLRMVHPGMEANGTGAIALWCRLLGAPSLVCPRDSSFSMPREHSIVTPGASVGDLGGASTPRTPALDRSFPGTRWRCLPSVASARARSVLSSTAFSPLPTWHPLHPLLLCHRTPLVGRRRTAGPFSAAPAMFPLAGGLFRFVCQNFPTVTSSTMALQL